MIFKATKKTNRNIGLQTNIGNVRDLFMRQNVFSDSDINAIKAYNNEFTRLSENAKQSSANVSNHTIAQKAANNTMKNASKAAQNVVANAKNGTVALNTLTTSSKAATISMKTLATAGNMLLFLGITKGIELAVKGIDKLIETKKEAEEALENAKSVSDSYRSSINDVVSSQNELASNTNNIKRRYAELSQGVDSMSNKNLSLSTDDYNEFLDLNSQLANLFPTLTKGYDENGNAILGLGNNIDTVTGKIQALAEQQKKLAGREILDNLESYVNGDDEGGGQLEEIKRLKKEKEDAEKLVRVHDDVRKLFDTDDISSVNKIAGISSGVIDPLMRKAGFNTNLAQLDAAGFWQFNLDESEMKHLKETFATYYQELKAEAQTTKDELTNANAEMSSNMMYWVQSLPQYTSAKDENMQTAMMNMVNGIDWTSAGASDYDSAKSVIQQLVLSPLNNLSDDPTTQKMFSTAISGLFSLDTADISANEAQEIIQNYIGKIMHILNKFRNEKDKLSLDDTYSLFGFSNLLENKANFSGSLSKIAGGNTPDMQKLSDYTKEFTLSQQQAWITATSGAQDAQSAIEQYENSIISSETNLPTFQDAWNVLDSSVKDPLLDLAKSGELTAKTLQETDGADTFLNQIGIGAEEAAEKIHNLLSTEEKLAAFSQGLSGLGNAFEEFQENKFVSAETLNSLPKAFKDLKGYDIFSQIVGDPESGTQKIQNAFDQIVTEYMESQNILDGANSQNKNEIIANLQQAGIGNAEDLVNSYINSMAENKPLIQGASDEILQYLSNNNEADVNNFIAALQAKNANYTELASALGDDNATLIAKFGSQYGDDLANWITLLNEKQEAYNQFVQEYNDSLGEQQDYFNGLDMPVERAVANGTADTTTLTQNANKVSTAKQNMDNAKKNLDETEQDTNKKIAKKLAKMQGKIDVSGYLPKSPSGSKDNNNTAPKETKQSFNWLERYITVLSQQIDLLKAKLENLFSVKAKNSNLTKQIKAVNKEIKAYTKEANIYSDKAKKYAEKNLSNTKKKNIDNGKMKGKKYKQLVQEYGEKDAKKIQEYMDLKDKAATAEQNKIQARTTRRELKIQKHQNIVDKYDAQSNKYDAQIKNAATAEAKKNLENKKITSTKKSYNQQIKIAKLEYGKKSPQVAKLKAEKKTAVRDIKIEKYQNFQNEADAQRDLLDAKIESADTVGDKNSYLQQQAYITSSYNAQIKIADLEGNTAKKEELKIKKQQELLENEKQQLQNLSDEQSALYELNQLRESSAKSAKEKNVFEADSRENLKAQYRYEIEIAKKNGDKTEADRLQLELHQKIEESYQRQIENLKEEYDLTIGLNDAKNQPLTPRLLHYRQTDME